MKTSDLQVGMKVRDRWYSSDKARLDYGIVIGTVKRVLKTVAHIEFTGDSPISGLRRWDREHIEEFIEPIQNEGS